RLEMFIRSISIHPDGKSLLVASSNREDGRPGFKKPGQVMMFEFPSFRLLNSLELGKAIMENGVKLSPDGELFAVHKKDSTEHWDPEDILIYDTKNFQKKASVLKVQFMPAFEFTPDNRFVIGGQYLNANKTKKHYTGDVLDLFD